ncbi:hypothetical protein Lalb_Chr08g0234341 [Lupinus albus]|uniref:Uncharacterized protein n=1 Tax=Lupinus albus TaxID=3870 RepID=A0A6A4Q399_LUPAL|nr:hypothetical protein Lalb_Chr08g0234341 [Lupinus albus]
MCAKFHSSMTNDTTLTSYIFGANLVGKNKEIFYDGGDEIPSKLMGQLNGSLELSANLEDKVNFKGVGNDRMYSNVMMFVMKFIRKGYDRIL